MALVRVPYVLTYPGFSAYSVEYKGGLKGSQEDEPAHFYHVLTCHFHPTNQMSYQLGPCPRNVLGRGPLDAETQTSLHTQLSTKGVWEALRKMSLLILLWFNLPALLISTDELSAGSLSTKWFGSGSPRCWQTQTSLCPHLSTRRV